MLYCPELPNEIEGGGRVGYVLHTHIDATGATVAVAEARCAPNRYFFDLSANNASISLHELEPLRSRVVMQCDHHTRHWIPSQPLGKCMTRENNFFSFFTSDNTNKALIFSNSAMNYRAKLNKHNMHIFANEGINNYRFSALSCLLA